MRQPRPHVEYKPIPRKVTPTLTDIGWLAGILEGEGSFEVQATCARLRVSQNGMWLPLRIQQLVGGKVVQGTRSFNSTDDVYVWRCSSDRALGIMLTVYPFLSPRRRAKILEIVEIVTQRLANC